MTPEDRVAPHYPADLEIRACEGVIDRLRAQNATLAAALRVIAATDYRGHRSTESQLAYLALKTEGLLQVDQSKGNA